MVGGAGAANKDQEVSSTNLKKDFDGSIKGNVYLIDGHKLSLPSNQANGSQGKLDIVHRYLVI